MEDVVYIYIKEVFIRYKVLSKIILDRDPKFISVFWEVFLVEQRVKAVTLIVYHLQIDGQIERLN